MVLSILNVSIYDQCQYLLYILLVTFIYCWTYRGEKMEAKFDLQHFCCGPKGCQIEIEYGEMMDAE